MSSFIEMFLSIALIFFPTQVTPTDIVVEVSTSHGCAGVTQCE